MRWRSSLMNSDPPTPPRRSWFQFSLATMFQVVLLVAIISWALSMRPYVEKQLVWTGGMFDEIPARFITRRAFIVGNLRHTEVYEDRLNPGLKWPCTLIIVCLSSNAAWCLWSRRRNPVVRRSI